MTGLQETGTVSGTKDKDYNLMAYVQSCLKNALRMETYLQDAQRDGDGELVELFTKAQADSRKGAEIGKKLLAARLADSGHPTSSGGGAPSGDQPPVDVMATDQAASK